MVEWLAGNRIRGTTAERPNFGLPSGSVGGWVEVGRTTLGGTGTTITASSLADKRYYMVLMNNINTGSTPQVALRLGNSTAATSGYAGRYSRNGAADATNLSATSMTAEGYVGANPYGFGVSYIANLSAKEKLLLTNYTYGTAGAGTAPNRQENATKWAYTSNPLDLVQMLNVNTSTFASGSEVVVLGWDPADSHTTNFWEELADTTFTSSGVSAQTFTAKKYIWCQFWFTSDASGNGQHFQLGDTGGIDTGSTYARRFSINGGADSTSTSQSKIYFAPQTGAVTHFVNMFMVNNASNEKLSIIQATTSNGSGAGNAPQRRETVGKWVETTNQCDRITIATDAGTFTGGQLKVWGSD